MDNQPETKDVVHQLMLYQENKGIRQKDLAKMLGVTEATISKWYRGCGMRKTMKSKVVELVAGRLSSKVLDPQTQSDIDNISSAWPLMTEEERNEIFRIALKAHRRHSD